MASRVCSSQRRIPGTDVAAGRYADRLVRTAEGWRYTLKQVRISAASPAALRKLQGLGLDLADSHADVYWEALLHSARDERRLKLAYSLMFTLPGTPVVRYGDELCMGDDLRLRERACARTAMQWSDEPHAGFTKNAQPQTPVIDQGPYAYQHINAAVQRRDPESMLNWTERIIRMRKEVPEIGWGDFTVLKVRDPAILALRYDWRNNSVLFLHNLHEQPREILLDPGVNKAEGKLLVNLLAEDHSKANESGKHRIVLEGYGYRWYRVGGLDYLLRRTDI